MKTLRQQCGIGLLMVALICGVASTTVFAAKQENARDGEWREVRDLYFGETLFHFYQRQYFSAITHLMAAQRGQRLPNHKDEAELLLGGMYLSYGLHKAAGAIFERLIGEGATQDIQDRAWFYLGKIRYQRGYLQQAESALGKVRNTLPQHLQQERQVLFANLLMKRGEYEQAIKILGELEGDEGWGAYGRYNLGIALVKSGKAKEGVHLLRKVAEINAEDEEMRSLKDKAYTALGYSFLKEQKVALAKEYLQQVRLDGLLSNKALLGTGWAYSAENNYEKALVHWKELHQRNVIDSAVQESLLAVPYALGKLEAYPQAMQHYREAIAVFEAEQQRLGYSIKSIRAGNLVKSLLELDPDSEMGWFWSMKKLPDAPETRYLISLLASHEFQEALKNYRDLRFLERNMSRWLEDTYTFDSILAVRRKAYENKLPRILKNYQQLDTGNLKARRDALAARVAIIEQKHEALALANSKEMVQLQILKNVNQRLKRLADKEDLSEQQDKYRLTRGVILWNIMSEFTPRLWKVKRGILDLDKALAETAIRRRGMVRAQRLAPRMFEGFTDRIAALRLRLRTYQGRTMHLARLQERYLQDLAVEGLQRQQQRLLTYLTQARFAVAQIFDKATRGVAPPQ